jgi:hypothetical protein
VAKLNLILKDGVRYLPHRYRDEKELHRLVESNINSLFGPDAFFFPGTRIGAGRKESGAKGIPDGFVIVAPKKRWYIIEVELASHSYFDHIASQVMRFYAAWDDPARRTELKNRFADAIQESPAKVESLNRHGIKEIYRLVSDTLEEKPTLAVIIDEELKDLDQLRRAVQFDVQYSVFRTFAREGISDLVPIFQIDSFDVAEGWQVPKPPRSNGEEKEFLVFLGKREPIARTKDILIIIANELIKRGVLTDKMLPWGSGKKRYLVSKKPIHPNGNDFYAPAKLENGWWVETHSGRDSTLSYARQLLKRCGQDAKISVEKAPS